MFSSNVQIFENSPYRSQSRCNFFLFFFLSFDQRYIYEISDIEILQHSETVQPLHFVTNTYRVIEKRYQVLSSNLYINNFYLSARLSLTEIHLS